MKRGMASNPLALEHFCLYKLSAPGGILHHGNQTSSIKQ